MVVTGNDISSACALYWMLCLFIRYTGHYSRFPVVLIRYTKCIDLQQDINEVSHFILYD